jgi:toxin ParE1/3/4
MGQQYLINALATRDLDDIAIYLGNISLESADQFLQEFDRRCIQLVSFPMSGKGYPHLRHDLRGLNFKNYIIFYRILADGIEIMRVVAGQRDLTSIFNN